MVATIKGIQVELTQNTLIGYDDFGAGIYSSVPVPVDNVLVSPISYEDAVDELSLSGKHIVYELAIPKGDTHDWTNTEVSFFGETFRTVGAPVKGIDDLVPLDWNAKIKVERYE